MKNKTELAATLLIGIAIAAVVLNFPEFLMGSPANTKNVIVTIAYMTGWIFVLRISIKDRDRKILTSAIFFWLATLLFSLLTAYVNATGALVDWAIPFVIILLGPWYGITIVTNSFLTASIIIALISFVVLTTAIVLLQRTKYD